MAAKVTHSHTQTTTTTPIQKQTLDKKNPYSSSCFIICKNCIERDREGGDKRQVYKRLQIADIFPERKKTN